jgi:hypothetical protein
MNKYTIIVNKISKKDEKKIINSLSKYKGFGKMKSKDLNNIHKKLQIDKNIILSVRSQYLKNKCIKNLYRIKNKTEKISSDYLNTNILDLSLKYNTSPMLIFRMLMKNKYPGMKSLKKYKSLDSYDKKQLNLAEKNDIIAPLDQDNNQLKADEFERKIEHFLKKKNISFKTEKEIAEEQIDEYGIVKATPDFLLDVPIIINNEIVNWIEVKNFYGTNINFLFSKIKKQTDKYYKIWGTGCLVFRYGITEHLKIKNVCIVSF